MTVHSDGRIETVDRKVYRINSQDEIEDNSSLEWPYQPWHQDKPEFRARVVDKSGAIHTLDPKTITDAPQREFDSNIFSDSRVLRAPLPALAVGSIVEVEVTLRDKTPLLDAGSVRRLSIQPAGLLRFHMRIEAETPIQLRVASQLIPETARSLTNTAKGGTRFEWDWNPPPVEPDKAESWEMNIPSDISNNPVISYSTARSWQAVAARYSAIVDERIASSDVKPLLAGVDTTRSAREVAAAISANVHQRVRYTGVEFGESAIVPVPPQQTLARGYGDCKDKATAMVAALRASGLKADVALLSSGYFLDVDPMLPGLGMFDHAIVFVAANPPLWIDATAADTRVGYLPSGDQGRLALIANSNTSALVRIPESPSSSGIETQNLEVRMATLGKGTIKLDAEVNGGGDEWSARASLAGGDDNQKTTERLENFMKRQFNAKAGVVRTVTARNDMSGPYRLSAEARESSLVVTEAEEAAFALGPQAFLDSLPYGLRPNAKGTATADEKGYKPRRHDFVFPEPKQFHRVIRIVPPAGYKLVDKPADLDLKLGPSGRFTRHVDPPTPDGVIVATYHLDTGQRRLTAEEFEAFRTAAIGLNAGTADLFQFAPESAEDVASGNFKAAIAGLQKQAAARPEDPLPHIRLSQILLTAGLGDAARTEAMRAAELGPKVAQSQLALGWALQHDSFARLRRDDWNPAAAEAALRKAIELAPDNPLAKVNLAIYLEYDKNGVRYAPGAHLDEAIALYRESAKLAGHPPLVEQNLAILLARLGRYKEARETIGGLGAQSSDVQLLLVDALTAIEDSVGRVLIKSQSAFPDSRSRATYLANVGQTCIQLRKYKPGATLMSQAARILGTHELDQRIEILSKLKPWQEGLVAETEPEYPAQKLLLEVFRGTLRRETLAPLLSRRVSEAQLEVALEGSNEAVFAVRKSLEASGIDEEGVLDILISMMTFDKSAIDEVGYEVSALVGGERYKLKLYVILEEGRYRILGIPPSGLDALATLLNELVERNDIKSAQRWLDRVVSDADPLLDGTGSPAIQGIWSGATEATRGAAAVRLAAAVLTGSSNGSPAALAQLEAARAKATNATERGQMDKAICETLRAAEKWPELMTAAKRLETSSLFFAEGFRYFTAAAVHAERWKDLEAEANRMLNGELGKSPGAQPAAPVPGRRVVVKLGNLNATSTNDVRALAALALARHQLGAPASAVDEPLTRIVASNMSDPDDLAMVAWAKLARGQVTADAMKQLTDSKRGKTEALQLAMSMLQVAIGKPDEAVSLLAAAVGSQALGSVPASAWIIHAALARRYGYPELAMEAEVRAKARLPKEKDETNAAWLRVFLGRK